MRAQLMQNINILLAGKPLREKFLGKFTSLLKKKVGGPMVMRNLWTTSAVANPYRRSWGTLAVNIFMFRGMRSK